MEISRADYTVPVRRKSLCISLVPCSSDISREEGFVRRRSTSQTWMHKDFLCPSVWRLESLFLVAENQELQKDREDSGRVNVSLAFGSRNL